MADKKTTAAEEAASSAPPTESRQSTEDRELGVLPIPKLFFKYTGVALMGMVAQIIMVVLEGIIMGNGLGSHGLACVSIIMSVELMNVALGSSLAVGVSTVVGSYLGAGDTASARRAFSQGFWLTAIIIVLLTVLIEIFCPQVVTFLGATPDIFVDTVGAIRVFSLGLPFCVIGQMLCGVLRVDEKPQVAAHIQIISAAIAIVWLALSTFVLKLGVTGAGLYYAASIGIWFVVIVYFIGGKRSALYITFSDVKLDPSLCWRIIKIGLPLFVLQATSSVYTTVVNNELGSLGSSLDIASFAIINGYVVYIIMMVVQGFTYGMQPIAAYNAGARAWGRLRELLRCTLAVQIVAIAVVTVVVWLAAEPICLLFAGDAELAAAALPATRIVILLGALGWTSQTISSYFECVERVVIATVLGISRYLLFTIPSILILGSMMGVDGVWWAQPVGDVLAFALTIVLVVVEFKRLNSLETEGA